MTTTTIQSSSHQSTTNRRAPKYKWGLNLKAHFVGLALCIFTTSAPTQSDARNAVPTEKADTHPTRAHAIWELVNQIDEKNPEVQHQELVVMSQRQSLRASRSRLWPNLSFSVSASKSDDSSVNTPATTLNSGAMSGSDQIASSSPGTIPNLPNQSEAYLGQITLGYFVFTKGLISDDIQRSEHQVAASEIDLDITRDQRRSQLLQLLLEWQLVSSIMPHLKKANQELTAVLRHKQSRAQELFSLKDEADLLERQSQLQMKLIEAESGLEVIESAIMTLLPEMRAEQLSKLPHFEIEYQIPDKRIITEQYPQFSRSDRQAHLRIKTADSYLATARLDKPWIPTIYWNASYSDSGDFDGHPISSGASTAIVASFNLFDGLYSWARLQQAKVMAEQARLHRQIERDKRILNLRRLYHQGRVAQAEANYKKSQVIQKHLRMRDVEQKSEQGYSSPLDLELARLDWINAETERIDALKRKQQAELDIAVELNQWEKVKIYVVQSN